MCDTNGFLCFVCDFYKSSIISTHGHLDVNRHTHTRYLYKGIMAKREMAERQSQPVRKNSEIYKMAFYLFCDLNVC